MLFAAAILAWQPSPSPSWRPAGRARAPTLMATKLKGGGPDDGTGPVLSGEERKEYLSQLFGETAAEKLAPPPPPPPTEAQIAMLQEGIQRLEWGEIRLVDVAMAVGPLELKLEPLCDASELLCVRLDLPLGMVLEEDAPVPSKAVVAPIVMELLDGGSARDGGVLVGDLLRATTYVTMGYKYETWKMMLGGGGTPALQKSLMPTSNQPFEQVMAAIASNSQQERGNGQIVLMIERPAAAGGE